MMNVAALTDHRRVTRTATVNPTSRCITALPTLERELDGGLLAAWNQLMDDDPLASCFQSPGWCLPWYRAYRDEFDPYVLLVQVADRLVGLVPLSVHRITGHLEFASGSMADYRDVVALPGFREVVVSEFIGAYLDGHFPNPLQIGWIDPASNTPLLIAESCRARRAPFISWQQPCWRWFPVEGENLNKKFSRIRTHLNHFTRTGKVSFDVVTSVEEWAQLRESFFEQHSLRQLHAGRELAFDDPRRVAFYDQLFASPDFKSHVTALRVDGRVLAGHFGYLWRDVLLLGAPAIRLEEEQRSPAVILFTWIIQNAQTLGLHGFDLTVGDTDFKKRLANQCVHPTTVEVFNRRHRYYLQTARAGVVHTAKAAVAKAAGPDAWNKWIKPTGAWLMYKKTRVAESGVRAAAALALRGFGKAIHDHRQAQVYSMTPAQLRRPGAGLGKSDVVSVRENHIEDLLLWRGSAPSTASALTTFARGYSRARTSNRSLHTIVINGRLAALGYSHYPTEPARLPEVPGAVVEFQSGGVYLYDFYTIPEFRSQGMYQALLTDILQKRFAEGAPRAYITAAGSDATFRRAIEAVGFEHTATHSYRRLLKWTTTTAGTVRQDPRADYEEYLRTEWRLFTGDVTRQREALGAAAGIPIRRVLDVGCGGGQDLMPFSTSGATSVGIDISHHGGVFGKQLFAQHYPDVRVHFATSTAEQLPFVSNSFSVVLCRVAIPYTHNRAALAEIARVLRPGGILFLKIHNLRYYTRKFTDGIRLRSPRFSIHALRVLLSGTIFHLTGWQPSGGILLRESFLSDGRLKKELARAGLLIVCELSDSNPLTRSYRVLKPEA